MELPHSPTGPDATRLLRRKQYLFSRLAIPDDALPGSLALSHRRCGKPTCHCAKGEGHPMYSLTFMVGGKKRVESIPADWIDTIRPAVEKGRAFKDAVAELFAINAQLFVLGRNQRSRPARKPPDVPTA